MNDECEITGCDSRAMAKCNWHTDSLGSQSANLCQEHIDELWKRLNPLLQINKASFSIGPVESAECRVYAQLI